MTARRPTTQTVSSPRATACGSRGSPSTRSGSAARAVMLPSAAMRTAAGNAGLPVTPSSYTAHAASSSATTRVAPGAGGPPAACSETTSVGSVSSVVLPVGRSSRVNRPGPVTSHSAPRCSARTGASSAPTPPCTAIVVLPARSLRVASITPTRPVDGSYRYTVPTPPRTDPNPRRPTPRGSDSVTGSSRTVVVPNSHSPAALCCPWRAGRTRIGRGPPPSSERIARTTSPTTVPTVAHATRIQTAASALRGRRARVLIVPCSLPPACRRSDALLELLELVDRHQDGPGLRALGRSDDTPSFQEVHEPAGAGEPYPQLALEHARRAEPAPHDQLHRLGEQVVVLVHVAAGAAAAGVVTGDALDVVRLWVLPPPVGDEPVDALLVDPRALDAPRPTRRRGDEQHVALTDQLVGARLVEDHA